MSTTLPEDPIPTPRLPGALDANKEHEHNPLESASATEPREIAHPVTLKTDVPSQDAATFRPPTQPHEQSVEERERLEKEAPTQSSLERITTGLGGMVLTAPLAMLEKVAPSFAHKVEDAASTIAHKVQDLTARADEENAAHAAAAPSSSSSAPVIRPGGEVTHNKADAALEKTATTGGDIASSIKDTAKSAAETIKEKVPSVAPSTSTTGQPELMHADASVARSQAAREEAARVTHSTGGVPSTSSAPSISETAHTLAETASHALDTVKSYLPTSLGGQGGSVTSALPHFTVVSSEDVPTSIEAEGTRKQVVPPEQRESSFEYPQQAEAKAVPVTENVKEVAQVAAEKVRELGNKAAEYLPSAEQQKQTAEQAADTLGQAASTASQQAANTAAVVGEKASQATEAVKSRLPAAEDVKSAIPSVEDVKSKLPTVGTSTKTTPEGTSTSGNKDWPPSGNTPYSTINPAPAKGVGASYNPLPAVTSTLTAAKDVAASTLHTAAYAVQTVEDAADLALHKAEDVAASALHGVENVAASGYQGVKQTVGGVVGATTSVASGAANVAGSAASTTYEGTKHAVGGVVGAATSTAGAVKDTASSALDTASSAASSTYEAAKNTAGQAVGATTSTAEAAKDKVAETASSTTSSAQQTLQSARDNASSAMEATHKSASERAARVEETIHKNAPVNLSQLRGDSAYSESEGGGTATILRDDHKDTVGRGFGMEGVERTEEVEREGEEAAKKALSHGHHEGGAVMGQGKENVRAIEDQEMLKITDKPDPSTRGKEEERPFDLAAGHNEPAVTSQAATHDPDASVKSHSSTHHHHPSTSAFAGDGNPAGSDRVAGGAQTQSAPLGGTARFVPGQERDARPVEPASTNFNATASRIPVSVTGGYADLAGKNLSGSDRVGHEHVGHTGGASFVPHSSGVKEDKGHTQPLPPDVDFTGSGSPSTYSSTHPHGSGPSTSHRTADSAPPALAQDQTGRGSPHTYSSSHEYKVPQGSVPLEQARQQQPAQAAQAQGSFQPQSHYAAPPQPPQQQHHDSGYHHQTVHHEGGEGTVVGHAKGEEEIQRLEAKEGRKLGEKILGKLHLKH